METLSNQGAAAEDIGIVQSLLLGENGGCFLCYKNLNNCQSMSEKTKSHKVSFRPICRYLQIDTNSIFNQVLGEDCPSELYSCELNVVLCDNCSERTTHLSRFLRQMEVLQMLVDYNIQQFYEHLKSTKGGETSQRCVEDDTDEAIAEAQILEILRKETLRTCGAKVKQRLRERFPVVKLERLENTDIPSPNENIYSTHSTTPDDQVAPSKYLEITTNQTDKASKCVTCQQNVTDFNETASSLKLSLPNSLPAPPSADFLHWLSNTVDACFTYPKTTQTTPYGMISCRYCPKMVRYAKWHIVSQHPEKLFLREKLDNVTEEDFKILCFQLLYDEVQSAKKVGQMNGQCQYCSSVGGQYANHLVTTHYSLLQEKLKAFQNAKLSNLPISNASEERIVKTTTGNKLECGLCKKLHSPTSFATKMHLISFHPEKLFLSSKLENVSEVQFEICCRHLFQVQMKKAINTGNGKWKCGHCSWNGGNYRNHLFRSHIFILENILNGYQQNKIWTESELTISQPTQTVEQVIHANLGESSLKRHTDVLQNVGLPKPQVAGSNTEECSSKTDSPIAKAMISLYTKVDGKDDKGRPRAYCSICKIRVKNVKSHLFTQHIEQCFPEKMLESLSATEFKGCCNRALNNILNQANPQEKMELKGKDRRLNCIYCEFSTYIPKTFRNHVMVNHYAVVEQTLMGEQRKCRLMQHSFEASELGESAENSEKSISKSFQKDTNLGTGSELTQGLEHQHPDEQNLLSREQQELAMSQNLSKDTRKRKHPGTLE